MREPLRKARLGETVYVRVTVTVKHKKWWKQNDKSRGKQLILVYLSTDGQDCRELVGEITGDTSQGHEHVTFQSCANMPLNHRHYTRQNKLKSLKYNIACRYEGKQGTKITKQSIKL